MEIRGRGGCSRRRRRRRRRRGRGRGRTGGARSRALLTRTGLRRRVLGRRGHDGCARTWTPGRWMLSRESSLTTEYSQPAACPPTSTSRTLLRGPCIQSSFLPLPALSTFRSMRALVSADLPSLARVAGLHRRSSPVSAFAFVFVVHVSVF
jgi:hypothetical protein